MTMHWIAGQTSTGSTGVFSFTNIPQTFQHLQIRITARSTYTGAENMFMRINNSSSSWWSGHALGGQGTSAYAASYTSNSYADFTAIANGSQSANVFSAAIIDIFDYASTTKNKTIKLIGGFDNNGSGYMEIRGALALTTGAITDIHQLGGTAVGGANVLAAGSRADLYGITSNPIATGA